MFDTSKRFSSTSVYDKVDLFHGNGTVDLPPAEGIARHWNWLKAQTGNTHPGACRPFGMVSVCPYSGMYPTGYGVNDSSSAYAPKQLIKHSSASGITHFHQSGVGNIRNFYNYLKVTPLLSCQCHIREPELLKLENERAVPGYYAAALENNIEFELTTGRRSAVHRYKGAGKLRIDLLHGGLTLEHEAYKSIPREADFGIDSQGRVTGSVVMRGITVYFCIKCSSGKASLFADGCKSGNDNICLSGINGQKPRFSGAVFFDTEDICELQLGFSFYSLKNAVSNQERTADFDCELLNSGKIWREHLGRIVVQGGSEKNQTIFYSSLYHALLKPCDCSGDSPFESAGLHTAFYDFSTMWDQYKTQLPLIYTVYPETGNKIFRFITDYIRQYKSFPVALMLENNSLDRFDKQASVLACYALYDGYIRNPRLTDIDSLIKTMETDFINSKRFEEFSNTGITRPVSHVLDLSGVANCIARLAEAAGYKESMKKFDNYASFWKNVFDNSTGLLRPEEEYYEGSHWNYSFRLMHDMEEKMKFCGSGNDYLDILDQFFGYKAMELENTNCDDFKREIIEHRFEGLNNETDMETPYSYICAGRHDRTAEIVRSIMRYQFGMGTGGLPGNDDSGGLTSWYVWNAIGLFPASGQDYAYIGSPIFEHIDLKLQEGDFKIKVNNNSLDNIYVKSVKLNGTDLNTMLLPVNMIKAGNVLELTMSNQPK